MNTGVNFEFNTNQTDLNPDEKNQMNVNKLIVLPPIPGNKSSKTGSAKDKKHLGVNFTSFNAKDTSIDQTNP